MQIFKSVVLLFFATFIFGCTGLTKSRTIPEDESWQTLTLNNGFKAHLKSIPGEAVSIRFLVRAGSYHETPKQAGYAHFLEHMAFNGTPSFPGNEALQAFEESGISFVDHINAFTSHTETVYLLDMPDDDKLNDAITWFGEIATSLTLSDNEIENEKGVVLAEQRQWGRPTTLEAKTFAAIASASYRGHSNIIGTPDSIRHLSPQALREFYYSNYTPERSEIIITGDFDLTHVKAKIRNAFENWVTPKTANRASHPDAVLPGEPFITRVSPLESPALWLMLDLGANPLATQQDYEQNTFQLLAATAISERLKLRAAQAFVPIHNVDVSVNSWSEARFLNIALSYDRTWQDDAHAFLAYELAAIRDHGFLPLEIESTFRQMESALAAQSELSASEVAEGRLLDIWSQRKTLSEDTQKVLFRNFKSKATPARVNEQLHTLLSSNHAFMVLGTDTKEILDEKKRSLAQDTLLVFKEMYLRTGQEIALSEDIKNPPDPVQSGEIVSIVEVEENITKWNLSNGVTLYLHTLPDSEDSVYVYSGSQGGLASLPPALRAAARMLPATYLSTGLAGLTNAELKRLMSAKQVYVQPYVEENLHYFAGESPANALPTLLSVIHHSYQNATFNKRAYEQVRAQMALEQSRYLDSNLGKSQLAMDARFYTTDSVRALQSPESFADTQLNDIESAYQALFKVNREMTYVVAGNITAEDFKPLVRRYVAGVSLKKAAPAVKYDVGYRSASDNITIAHAGHQTNNLWLVTTLISPVNVKSAKDGLLAEMTRSIMTGRLIKAFRESTGFDYTPSANIEWPDGANQMALTLTTQAPVIKRKQAKQTLDAILNAMRGSISEAEYVTAKEQLSTKLKINANKPKIRTQLLFNDALFRSDLLNIDAQQDTLKDLTLEELQQFMYQFTSGDITRFNVTNLPN